MDEATPTTDMRVATLNLWGRRGAWEERRRVLADGFRELAPDLVAFQEAVVTENYDQVTDILGPGYHLAHQTERELGRGGGIEDGQGISIASRWPRRVPRLLRAALTRLLIRTGIGRVRGSAEVLTRCHLAVRMTRTATV